MTVSPLVPPPTPRFPLHWISIIIHGRACVQRFARRPRFHALALLPGTGSMCAAETARDLFKISSLAPLRRRRGCRVCIFKRAGELRRTGRFPSERPRIIEKGCTRYYFYCYCYNYCYCCALDKKSTDRSNNLSVETDFISIYDSFIVRETEDTQLAAAANIGSILIHTHTHTYVDIYVYVHDGYWLCRCIVRSCRLFGDYVDRAGFAGRQLLAVAHTYPVKIETLICFYYDCRVRES